MPHLFGGSILRIDLSSGKIATEPTDKYKLFVGGRGINTKLVFDAVKPGSDPLGPDNAIAFGTGPLTGTMAPGSSRCEITAKSPVTNLLGESNLGGYFAAELKFAGYDHLLVTGKAEKPVYIYIENDRVEIRDASHLWGRADSFDAPVQIRKEVGQPDAHVVNIGKAGENRVVFASVITKLGNAAGRTGMGAVMGSKNLKAVAVRGTRGVSMADPQGYYDAAADSLAAMKASPVFSYLSTIGTSEDIDGYSRVGTAVSGNYQVAGWDDIDKAAGYNFRRTQTHKKFGCFSCPVRCLDFYDVPGLGSAKVSCQTYNELTNKTLNTDQMVWWEQVLMVQKYGIDPISLGSVISWLMHLHELGIITEKDTDGIPMIWGDKDAILKMTEKICNRDGVGEYLARGVKAAAEHIGRGSDEYLYHIKGNPLYNTNYVNFRSKGLAATIGVRGDGIRGNIAMENLVRIELDNAATPEEYEERRKHYEDISEELSGVRTAVYWDTYEGKAAMIAQMEEIVAITDLMLHCKWHSPWYDMPVGPEHLARFMRAGTGADWTVDQLTVAARRLRALERAFDAREGLTRDQDTLPKRFFEKGIGGKHFPTDDHLDREKFEQMKTDYYAIRGWDTATGTPTRHTLEGLGLKDVADELERLNKLPHPAVVSQAVEVPA